MNVCKTQQSKQTRPVMNWVGSSQWTIGLLDTVKTLHLRTALFSLEKWEIA